MKLYLRILLPFLFSAITLCQAYSGTNEEKEKAINKKGIPILVFHRVGNRTAGEYRVSIKDFSAILKILKDNNFCPVGLDEIISNRFRKECAGKKLFCINFDDSHISQMKFYDDGSLDSSCMTAILLSYFDNPRATYFINVSNGPPPWIYDSKKKIEFLRSKGMIIANHTASHKRLDSLKAGELIEELGKVFEYTNSDTMFLSYPYGHRFRNEKLLKDGFTYHKHKCYIKAAFTEVEQIENIKTRLDTLQLVRHLCPLGDTQEFSKRQFELPRINISTIQAVNEEIIKNQNILIFENPDSSAILHSLGFSN
jgi:peptidoglycan/xylan/chitin deacetylase (PgdA/CDA1 family)